MTKGSWVKPNHNPPHGRCTKILTVAQAAEREPSDLYRSYGLTMCGRGPTKRVGMATLCAQHEKEAST